MKHSLLKRIAYLPFSRSSLSALIITGALLSANLVGLNLAVGQATLKNTKIAFQSNRDGNEKIYVMNSDGTDPINLTNHPVDDHYLNSPVGAISESRLFAVGAIPESRLPSENGQKTEN